MERSTHKSTSPLPTTSLLPDQPGSLAPPPPISQIDQAGTHSFYSFDSGDQHLLGGSLPSPWHAFQADFLVLWFLFWAGFSMPVFLRTGGENTASSFATTCLPSLGILTLGGTLSSHNMPA